jgi:hypothetical protein
MRTTGPMASKPAQPTGSMTSRPSQPTGPKARKRRRVAGPIPLIAIVAVAAVSALLGATFAINALEKPVPTSASSPDGPLFGASASNTGALSQATSQFGHMPIVRVFYPGLPSPSAWTAGAPGVSHSAVVVSFNALPSAILSGADDAALSHFFDTAPTGHAIFYSYYHEPEPSIRDGKFTADQFKAAWTHIVSLADAAHNPDLQSTLILMAYDLSPSSGRNWKDYLPGGNVISTLGWDAYPAGSILNRNPQLTPPASFMGAAVAASKSVGLPFGFAEFGLSTPNGRPGWLKEVGSYLASVGALFGTYFDSTGWPAIFMTDSPSVSAWRSVIASSGTNVPLAINQPPPTPAPPTSTSALQIQGLTVTPTTFQVRGSNHVTLSFTLTQAADITVCFLGSKGQVMHLLARPGVKAGPVRINYYGASERTTLVGAFPVLIVASNSHGSTSAESSVTITTG